MMECEADDARIPRDSLAVAIESFCTSLVGTRRRSPKTEKAYRCDLQQFGAVVGFDTLLSALAPTHIERWLAHLRGRAYKASSVRRKIASVHGFVRRQRRRGAMVGDPFDVVDVDVGRDHRLTRTLLDGEFELLLVSADRRAEGCREGLDDRVLLAKRDQAMVWLLCGTGLRVGELVALTVRDTDIVGGALRVQGKGGRQRLAFVVDGDRERLASYLRTRALFSLNHDRVFVNHRGRPITTEGVRGVVARLASAGGLDRRVTPHMLRHTAATRLLQHGANLRIVQEFLGHASIRMTERYTHVTATALREAVKRHSPLNPVSATH
jgi:site-specific recombinase XerD